MGRGEGKQRGVGGVDGGGERGGKEMVVSLGDFFVCLSVRYLSSLPKKVNKSQRPTNYLLTSFLNSQVHVGGGKEGKGTLGGSLPGLVTGTFRNSRKVLFLRLCH